MPGAPSTDLGSLTSSDTRLVLLDPARAVAAFVFDFVDLELNVGLFNQSTLSVSVHKDSDACTVEYSSTSAIDDNWEEWSLDFFYRGTKVFSGPIQIVTKDRPGYEGEAYVTLVAESWFPALMRRRLVMTDDNSNYSHTDSWDDIFRDLVATNCVTGSVVEPSAGAQRQAHPGGRDDFGSFTVTVEADTGTAESVTYQTEMGNNLLDTLLELCTSSETSSDHYLWPTVTETSAGTFEIGCLVDRDGAQRGIGTNLTATVKFSSSWGNVSSFSKELDRTPLANLWMVTADGIGTEQRIRYKEDTTSQGNVGIYEDGLNLAHAGTDDECDQEAARLIHEVKDAWTTWTAEIVESPGHEWPTDFDIKDSITVIDHVYTEVVADLVIGVKLQIPAPGPPHLSLVFGKMPRSTLADHTRSGGGGRGGRGGGGRPRSKSGDTQPGRRKWQTLDVEGAVTLEADQSDDNLTLSGESTSTYVELVGGANSVDDGSGLSTDEHIRLHIVGHPVTSDPGAANSYITIRGSDGNDYRLLAVQATGSGGFSWHV